MFDLDYHKKIKAHILNKERLKECKSNIFNRKVQADLKFDIHRLNNHNLTNVLIKKFNPDYDVSLYTDLLTSKKIDLKK